MSRVVWRAFADFEKEEAWINEQAAKGLAFTRYKLFRYTFIQRVRYQRKSAKLEKERALHE